MLALGAPAAADGATRFAILVVASTGPADVRFVDDAARQARLLRGTRVVRLERDRTDSLVARLQRAIAAVPRGVALYVYIAGHGDRRGIRAGPTSWITPLALRDALAAGRFARALVAVEACDSGVFGRAASARIAVLTSAAPHENSYASRYDAHTGQWRGDEFSDALAGVVRAGRTATLATASARIERDVWSSHPQLYGSRRSLELGTFFGA